MGLCVTVPMAIYWGCTITPPIMAMPLCWVDHFHESCVKDPPPLIADIVAWIAMLFILQLTWSCASDICAALRERFAGKP